MNRQQILQHLQTQSHAYFAQAKMQALHEAARNLPTGDGTVGASGGGAESAGTGTIVFNGTNQYVQARNSDVVGWLPGTGPFTIEWFMKKGTGGAGAPRVFSLGFDTGATIGCSIEGGKVYIWPYGGSLNGNYPASYSSGNWMHVAICRDGSSDTRLYVDGVLKMTVTGDTRDINDSINPGFDLNMGVDNPSAGSPNWWAGNFTNFRWVNSALYAGASLTVPTAPLTQVANTKLLLLGGSTNNPVKDATGINNLVNHGATWDADTPFA